ncbi:MAG: MIP/aquaporin family protein [Fimbriiglobus sp.]
MLRLCLSEFLGTFILVFAGTGAIVVNDVGGGSVTHVGIALTFGLVVMALIYALGPVSGAHMNPAVSVTMTVFGDLPRARLLPYVVSQCLGAIVASLVLKAAFPSHLTLGSTLPRGPHGVSWVFEFLLTMILIVIIFGVTRREKEWSNFVGIVVGGTIGLEAMFAGPICGASMNPARSLAPALVSGRVEEVWIYLTAPVLGALFGGLVSTVLYAPEKRV